MAAPFLLPQQSGSCDPKQTVPVKAFEPTVDHYREKISTAWKNQLEFSSLAEALLATRQARCGLLREKPYQEQYCVLPDVAAFQAEVRYGSAARATDRIEQGFFNRFRRREEFRRLFAEQRIGAASHAICCR